MAITDLNCNIDLLLWWVAVDLILKRAKGIEEGVLSIDGNTSAQYKAKIRSLFVNLKDKNNPGLREAVVSGEIHVDKLCNMSSEVWNIVSLSCSHADDIALGHGFGGKKGCG